MEFDKSRIYSAVNADELRAGDKVITANAMADLKTYVKANAEPVELVEIKDETELFRFCYQSDKKGYNIKTALAYLVERKENCTNCEELGKAGGCCPLDDDDGKTTRCWLYKPKNEPTYKWVNYRPFKDVDELCKVWLEKGSKWQHREVTMPLIWVRRKESNCKGQLITKFSDPLWVIMSTEAYNMTDLLVHFTFLDGSPCGVEE